MRIVVQRCQEASVEVENEIVGKINHGMVLLVCLEKDDNDETLKQAIYKLENLRLFDDEQGKINLNIKQTDGKILAISQFTLSWRGEKGHRPSFDRSMASKEAAIMFAKFCQMLREVAPVETGRFGGLMKLQLINDGPVTFILDL
jgi:D-tyrosyl-tRNA(Tyr) deacylase